MNLQEKYQKLKEILKPLHKIAIAFSGGVDSSFLLAAANEVLGPQNVLACIGISPSLSQYQLNQARKMAALVSVRLLEIPLAEMDDPNYQANRADRCFHCKSHQFGTIQKRAIEEGFTKVACGSNFDDKNDFRPGSMAVTALGIMTPLMESQLTKEDIRTLSRQLNLPAADAPASPCLASRIAYGVEITEHKLKQVEQAEDFLRSTGFVQFRVRHHGSIARIEVPCCQLRTIVEDSLCRKITEKLKALGFQYVTLDLQGFRSGSLNETLAEDEKQTR